MSDYNVKEAEKWTVTNGAYLARDMDWDGEVSEKRVDRWREITMQMLQQHRAAHKEIERLQRENADLIDDNSRLIIDFDEEINLKDQHIARLEAMLDRLADEEMFQGCFYTWQDRTARIEYAASHRSKDDE